jgi:Insertion element 4 transposase N-terminal/Transposase DDE domain
VPFYRPGDDDATDDVVAEVLGAVEETAGGEQRVVGPPAGMVAARVAGLVDTGRGRGAGALVIADAVRPARGEAAVFCQPVACAPVVVRRDGRVQAEGWLPEQVRLGILEHHLGRGTIERLVSDPVLGARPGTRRRAMSLPLTARFTLAMTLLPDAAYPEVMARLVGLLPGVPWRRGWRIPGAKVVTNWRRRLGPAMMRQLFHEVVGLIDPEPDWCGLVVGAIDGFSCRLPDTPANRERFGSAGTADDTAGFPSLHSVIVTAARCRATLAADVDAAGVGEQTLLSRLVEAHPEVFCAGRVFCMDRNFPGYTIIDAIRECGAHLVMRIKSDITLTLVRWLPDGSYLAWLGKEHPRLVRVVEYDVDTSDGVSELFCLATTLLDEKTYPAGQIARVYPKRWTASETTIGENKSLVTDAGPSRGPILRSGEPDLVIQELYAWLTAAHLVRKAAHATTRHATRRPVEAGEVSFTATRHEVTRSITQTLVTATTSLESLHTYAEQASRSVLARLVTPNRDRHSDRRRKHQPRFPQSKQTTPTIRGKTTINLSRSPVHTKT